MYTCHIPNSNPPLDLRFFQNHIAPLGCAVARLLAPSRGQAGHLVGFITSFASVTLLVLTEPCEILVHERVVNFCNPGLVLAEITVKATVKGYR